jgi:hypothetical protein
LRGLIVVIITRIAVSSIGSGDAGLIPVVSEKWRAWYESASPQL